MDQRNLTKFQVFDKQLVDPAKLSPAQAWKSHASAMAAILVSNSVWELYGVPEQERQEELLSFFFLNEAED